MLDEMICIKISQMIAPRPTAVADTPALDHGETDDNPIPEPSARSNNESAAATKPPAMMAAHGQITDSTVYQVAASVGLDVDRLKRDMASPEVAQELKANLALADVLDIHGTPAFIIGDRVVPGAVDLDALKTMVADARKQ